MNKVHVKTGDTVKIISGKEVSAYEKGLIADRVKALKEKGIILEDSAAGVKWRRA